jgi:hypothetical protein
MPIPILQKKQAEQLTNHRKEITGFASIHINNLYIKYTGLTFLG